MVGFPRCFALWRLLWHETTASRSLHATLEIQSDLLRTLVVGDLGLHPIASRRNVVIGDVVLIFCILTWVIQRVLSAEMQMIEGDV